ncbi:hypothetical protein AC1031_012454 [Aphanomyces cochlioides]|nr:hypothetical protein AC1031_012454 [Aphanomyces cochlioides]
MGTKIKNKLKQELAHQATLPLESIDDIKQNIPATMQSKSLSMKICLRVFNIESAVKRSGDEYGKMVNLIDSDADEEDFDMIQKLPQPKRQAFFFRLTVFNNMCDKIASWKGNDIVTVEANSLQKYGGDCCQGTLSAIVNHIKITNKQVPAIFQPQAAKSTQDYDTMTQGPHTAVVDSNEDSQETIMPDTDGSQDPPKTASQSMPTRASNVKKRSLTNDTDRKPTKRSAKHQDPLYKADA